MIWAETWPSWLWVVQLVDWVKIIVLVKHKNVYKRCWSNISTNLLFEPWSSRFKLCCDIEIEGGCVWMQGKKKV